MANVEIYTKDWCGYSARAKSLLDSKNVGYVEFDVTEDLSKEAEMVKRAAAFTVPQIFIDDQHVGGSDDLYALEASGVLDQLLANDNPEILS